MIRINLLPYHELAVKETKVKQIFVIGGAFALFFVLLGVVHFVLLSSLSGLEKDVKAKEERVNTLNRLIGEVDNIRKEKAILEKKLAIIKKLEEGRLYPVRMLADVAAQVPVKDVWLDKLTQRGTSLALEGSARDNFAVVRLMKNLEVSPFFRSVELVSTKEYETQQMKLHRFVLNCELKGRE